MPGRLGRLGEMNNKAIRPGSTLGKPTHWSPVDDLLMSCDKTERPEK